jgi:hypothetical protein
LKVVESSYQYQLDDDGTHWVVRYDYLRDPQGAHPPGHVQINGTFAARVDGDMRRIHLPTGRVSLEAILRLLIEDFNVPSNEPPEIWRPVLAESEAAFEEIAHRPLSGPAA